MIGNKCDLENDRVISKEQGQAAANEWGGGRMKHYETSAKSNINVTEVIILIRAISKTWIRIINIKLTTHINDFYFFTFQVFEEIVRMIVKEDAAHGLKKPKKGKKKGCSIL